MEKLTIRGDQLSFAFDLLNFFHQLMACYHTATWDVRTQKNWYVPAGHQLLARFGNLETFAGQGLYFERTSAIRWFLQLNGLTSANSTFFIDSVVRCAVGDPAGGVRSSDLGPLIEDLYRRLLTAIAAGEITEEMLKEPEAASV